MENIKPSKIEDTQEVQLAPREESEATMGRGVTERLVAPPEYSHVPQQDASLEVDSPAPVRMPRISAAFKMPSRMPKGW